MSDSPIDRLSASLSGRYRIEREIGEGGMASVYLAEDLRHQRKVALKVLKSELAVVVGAERFLAEIKTTANLQHPHILPLHDSGEADGFLYFVMPYIEGETLRDRIDRERQLPVDEALGIATAVANALQTAHDQGVVHRDIKPSNILLSRGEPLVADFGISLAISAGGGGRLTETGLSVGTPYYMSPEQATGDQAVGPASDTFALACVLYEMLVGEPPYPGNTAQAVLGKIIQGVPVSATAVRKSVPENVDAAIRKALEKLPADRFAGAHDFAKALADPTFRHGAELAPVHASAAPWKRATAAFASATAVLGIALAWVLLRPEPPRPVERFESPFRNGQAPTFSGNNAFNLSPDGTMLVYRGPTGTGSNQLWVRRWDDLDATPVRETRGATQPAIAPDGRELAFERSGEIRVLAFEGGPVRALGDGTWPRWGPDGFIYFSTPDGVARVKATGGIPELVTELTEGETGRVVTDVLPGGEAALLMVGQGRVEIMGLELESGRTKSITLGRWPRYAMTGHLLYIADDRTLMGAPFDPRSLEITGPAVPLVEDVTHYALSRSGDLVYTSELQTAGGANTELAWVSREGEVSAAGWEFLQGGRTSWALSPDGKQATTPTFTAENLDIWVSHLPEGPPRRLTFDEGEDITPWWSHDGQTVFYSPASGGIWSVSANGTGEPTLLVEAPQGVRSGVWSADGEWLVARTRTAANSDDPGRDLVAFRQGSDSLVHLIATPQFAEQDPALSPDGRWLAYTSNETGAHEVWVTSFPDVGGGKWRVSLDGGAQPEWAHNGRELFYISTSANEVVAADLEFGAEVTVVRRTPLFGLAGLGLLGLSVGNDAISVAPDDQRFLVARRLSAGDSAPAVAPYVLVQNFFTVLEAMVPR